MMGLFKQLKLLTYADNVISAPRMFRHNIRQPPTSDIAENVTLTD